MSGISGTGKDKSRYRYYQCMTSKRHKCSKKPITKAVAEKAAFDSAMMILSDKSMVKRISERCFSLQSSQSTELSALKKQWRLNKKETDNLMKAIKAGIITKSTKAELEQLEREQEGLELRIAQEQIKRPVISLEQIELWITHFAKTELTAPEQQQRLIDILINGIYVYDDKMVVAFNYKDVPVKP